MITFESSSFFKTDDNKVALVLFLLLVLKAPLRKIVMWPSCLSITSITCCSKSTRAVNQSPSLPAVGRYTEECSEGKRPGGESSTETKLGEGVSRTLRWGESELCHMIMVPPLALGCVKGRSMSCASSEFKCVS